MEQAATRTAEEEEEKVERKSKKRQSVIPVVVLRIVVVCVYFLQFLPAHAHSCWIIGLYSAAVADSSSSVATNGTLDIHRHAQSRGRAREQEQEGERESETATRRIIVLSKGTCFPHRGNYITLLFTLPTRNSRERERESGHHN